MASRLKLATSPLEGETYDNTPKQQEEFDKDASFCSFSLDYELYSSNSQQRRHVMAALCPHQANLIMTASLKAGSEFVCKNARDFQIGSLKADTSSGPRPGDSHDKPDYEIQQRISASSKVNFIHLSEAEQVARYRSTRNEYLAMKKKMAVLQHTQDQRFQENLDRKLARKKKEKRSHQDALLLEAHKRIRAMNNEELPECGSVVENLATSLATGAMKTDSLEFALLCNLVRKVKMNVSQKQGLSLRTKANSFLKSSSREQLIHFIKGEEATEALFWRGQPVQHKESLEFEQKGRMRAEVSGMKVRITQ